MTQRLEIVPLTFRQACAFVERHHRHHHPPRGAKFCLGVRDQDGELRGVAMIGRPVARHYDDGYTAEVNRTCTDGTANANSALYGAAWRAARAISQGYAHGMSETQTPDPQREQQQPQQPEQQPQPEADPTAPEPDEQQQPERDPAEGEPRRGVPAQP
jgi:hypothetical protein